MYEYKCKILKIVDGDTVDIDIDLGFDIKLTNQRIRINGIDTPESRTSDPIEKQYGLLSKKRVEELLPVGSIQTLKTFKDNTGKFGRILGDFIINGNYLTSILITEHLAVLYHGQSKTLIEEQHLKNRELIKLD